MPPLGAHVSSDGEREVDRRGGPFRFSSEVEATGPGDRPDREWRRRILRSPGMAPGFQLEQPRHLAPSLTWGLAGGSRLVIGHVKLEMLVRRSREGRSRRLDCPF